MKIPAKPVMIRYFKGISTPEEREIVELYLAMNRDHAYVESCLREAWADTDWTTAGIPDQQHVDLAWAQFAEQQKSAKPLAGRTWKRAYSYAASVAILLSLCTYLFITLGGRGELPMKEVAAAYGSTRTIVLDDSSTVVLYPGATIRIPGNFNDKDRSVYLAGRAFFDVTHNASKPFEVRSGPVKTRVLGTSFEVSSGTSPTSGIFLKTGKVEVLHEETPLATLYPGQRVQVDTLTGEAVISVVKDDASLHWLQGGLSYQQESLDMIFRDFETWYGMVIRVNDPSLLDKKITASFIGLRGYEAMDILSVTAGFRYSVNDHVFSIDKP